MSIARAGKYDYFKLKELDTPEILDLLEFTNIWGALEELASNGD